MYYQIVIESCYTTLAKEPSIEQCGSSPDTILSLLVLHLLSRFAVTFQSTKDTGIGVRTFSLMVSLEAGITIVC